MKRLGAILSGLLLLTAPAWAHSALQRTDPPANAVLQASPNEIRLWFSEPIKAGLSTIAVRDAAGKQVDRQDLHPDAKEPALVHLTLRPTLPAGVYQVIWSAVAQDLHVSKGSFSFKVTR